MCGIVGAISQQNIANLLLKGLQKLEYRGYDSAGIAVFSNTAQDIERLRVKGKVSTLAEQHSKEPIDGQLGIAHTRWATHGQPSELNAHPHFSGEKLAVVHNGIIENYQVLKAELLAQGYQFESDTDTEVIAHLVSAKIDQHNDTLAGIRAAMQALHGAYALGIILANEPDHLYAVRQGSPLVVGVGNHENFIASDPLPLADLTQQFIYLDNDDIARLSRDSVEIFATDNQPVKRDIQTAQFDPETTSKGHYRHFMQKEIFEQVDAINETLDGYILQPEKLDTLLGPEANAVFKKIKRVHLVACGTSYFACFVGQYWLEKYAGIPCKIEVASEFRYRHVAVEEDTLFLTISQSGETADTLAALRIAKEIGFLATAGICNVPHSTLARETDFTFFTQAGVEVGVAATKSFTTQLVALLLMALNISRQKNRLDTPQLTNLLNDFKLLPRFIGEALKTEGAIKAISPDFSNKQHVLFLGRGEIYPIAREGALKLKEISYIHAEAYAAGELKHGPLALVDDQMPVIVLAPMNSLFEKLAANVEEIRARDGQLYIFTDNTTLWGKKPTTRVIHMPSPPELIAPIVYAIPMQLMAYHIAVVKNTNIDQPRNLAKSVTVE